MNIFVLDLDPQKAAEYHMDKHVVKMILEYAQLLSTAHHVLGSPIAESLYKPTHKNHPCSVWVRENVNNYDWLLRLFHYLSKEYTHRYNKIHATFAKLADLLSESPPEIPLGPMTPFALAMPEVYKSADPVAAYRAYYIGKKSGMAVWTNRPVPEWFNN